MTTDAGRPPVAGGAVDDGLLIGDGDGDRDVERDLGPEIDRPSEPSGLPLGLCPFLATQSGAWRGAFPSHEHLCTAVEPPVPLALDKQRRLCLVAYHETCATYRAALVDRAPAGANLGAMAVGGRDGIRLRARMLTGRPVARTTPILLERLRPGLALPPAAGRSLGQVVLVGLVIIAFILIALARLGTPGSPAAAPGSSSPVATFSPTRGTTEAPTAQPTAQPSSQPSSVSSSPSG